MAAIDVAGEFETIERLLAPLAHPEWGRGLRDDVGVVPSRPGYDLVLTKDALAEGVHFLADDPLDTVAQKLLRVNLSDLAAKGAEPFGYMLACHWSERCGWPERKAFAQGLARDQKQFGIALIGGDTVNTPGPSAFSATMFGWTPKGRTVGRNGAQPGDLVFVTGTIGEGWLGLQAATGRLALEPARQKALIEHYRRPTPKMAFGEIVRDMAHASIDISDGLIADLGHIAASSGVGIEVSLDLIPLSAAAQSWMEGRVDAEDALRILATGGDDYEIALMVPPRLEGALRAAAEWLHIRVTAIGRVEVGQGVTATHGGEIVDISTGGWVHG